MALEERIEELTTAVKTLTAQLKAGGGAAAPAAAATRGPGRPAGSGTKAKFTAEQVKAAVVNVKDTIGTPAAKTIIADAGAKDLADLLTKKDKFEDVMTACEEALKPDEEAGDGEDEGGL